MTSAYKEQASSVPSTFMLIDDNSVMVTYKVDLNLSDQVVTWNKITAAEVSCNSEEAILKKNCW